LLPRRQAAYLPTRVRGSGHVMAFRDERQSIVWAWCGRETR
jgi:hypothetical protein